MKKKLLIVSFFLFIADACSSQITSPSYQGVFYSGASTGTMTTEGLLVHLDAGNSSSYPGSGAVWYDLTGNGYTAGLTSTSFDSGNGGSIYFDGDAIASLNNSLTIPNSWSNAFTLELWFKVPSGANWNAISDPDYPYGVNAPILCKGQYTNSVRLYKSGGSTSEIGAQNWKRLRYGLRGSSNLVQPYGATEISMDNWYQVVMTWDGSLTVKGYINGLIDATETAAGSLGGSPAAGNMDIGSAHAFGGNTGARYVGFVSIVRVYSRALNAQEIMVNFNYNKVRYGL